jgi:hypothetical protein
MSGIVSPDLGQHADPTVQAVVPYFDVVTLITGLGLWPFRVLRGGYRSNPPLQETAAATLAIASFLLQRAAPC